MREIKFRLLDKKENKVVYTRDVIINIHGDIFEYDFEKQNYVETNNYNILQYTGLKDKNGKKIYEGDILRYISKWLDHPRDFIVKFKDGFFGQEEINRFGYIEEGHEIDIWIDWEELEIIGNIYENPELLKK